jgi:pimeloyl-ACP methyl ester carboxylesterase
MRRIAPWFVVLLALLMAPSALARARRSAGALDPIIFVHGFEGSGGQFESQQLRFVENGYPARYVQVLEYNTLPATGVGGLNPLGIPLIELGLFPRLDRLIAQVKAQTGRSKVELVAHSLGTKLMQDYLNSSRQRAANVAHYVNIDGQTAKTLPGGVPTLALWATRGPLSPPGRSIGGAVNVSIPDSTHVQSATSPRSFRSMYSFFTGRAPRTTQIVAQKGRIKLSGKDLNFPVNGGLTGATVQAWPVNAAGRRTSAAPIATFKIGPGGDFGPLTVRSGTRLEFAELRSGFPTHHFYFEPFIRSDHLIRLLESDLLRSAGGVPEANSVAMLVLRYKELWGDQGPQSDVLTVNGLSVSNAKTCPLSKEVNGLFVADFDHDDRSNTSFTWPLYAALGFFISSVDVFAPARNPPTGEVTVGLRSRGAGPVRKISFPNWPGTSDIVTAQFDDWNPPPAAKCAARHRRGARGGCRRSR